MHTKRRKPEETYGPALERARLALPSLEPLKASEFAAVHYEPRDAASGQFQIPFLGRTYLVAWPNGQLTQAGAQEPVDITTQILLLHYLLTADGTPVNGQWIAFRNLPGGLGYFAAFQGRASYRLAHTFGHDRPAFEAAARALLGERLTFGDSSFLFRALPRVWLAVVLNLGDEEFAPDANVLFDAAASHYLPTEDLAVLGGLLASYLVKAARTKMP
jgi:hypothetical protein